MVVDLLLGLSRDWTFSHGPPSYQAAWAAHHELGVVWPTKPYSSTPSSNGSWVSLIRPVQALKTQVSCMKKWPKCPWSPFLLHWLLSPRLYLRPHGEFPKIGSQKKRGDSGLLYRWFCMICWQHQKVESCSTTTPFWDIPEGQWWREILSGDRTSSGASGCYFAWCLLKARGIWSE